MIQNYQTLSFSYDFMYCLSCVVCPPRYIYREGSNVCYIKQDGEYSVPDGIEKCKVLRANVLVIDKMATWKWINRTFGSK